MKIVVLAGGLCSERNVSIVSGKQVYNALRKKGHNNIINLAGVAPPSGTRKTV